MVDIKEHYWKCTFFSVINVKYLCSYDLKGYKLTSDFQLSVGKMAPSLEVIASTPDGPGSVPGTWMAEGRTDSVRLSSALHTFAWHACAHTHAK